MKPLLVLALLGACATPVHAQSQTLGQPPPQPGYGVQQPPQYSPQPQYGVQQQPTAAQPVIITMKAWCPMKQVQGIGRGPTMYEARQAAIKACTDAGGFPQCCYQYTRQIQ